MAKSGGTWHWQATLPARLELYLAGGPPGAVMAAVSARGGGGQAAREQRVRLVAVLEGGEEQHAALLEAQLERVGDEVEDGVAAPLERGDAAERQLGVGGGAERRLEAEVARRHVEHPVAQRRPYPYPVVQRAGEGAQQRLVHTHLGKAQGDTGRYREIQAASSVSLAPTSKRCWKLAVRGESSRASRSCTLASASRASTG